MKTQQHLEVSIDTLQTDCLVSEIVACWDFGIDWVFLCWVTNSDYRVKSFLPRLPKWMWKRSFKHTSILGRGWMKCTMKPESSFETNRSCDRYDLLELHEVINNSYHYCDYLLLSKHYLKSLSALFT